MILLWPMLAAATGLEDTLGPMPAGTTLTDTEVAPEYARAWLTTATEAPDGRAPPTDFVVEITPSRDGSGAVCTGGGVDLWVRLDVTRSESFSWDPLPAIVDQTCARLAEHRLVFAPPPKPPNPPPPVEPEPPPRLRPLRLLVLGLVAAIAVAFPRDRLAVGLFAVALVQRLSMAPKTVLLGGDAAFERLVADAYGGSNPTYGDAWPSFMAVLGGPFGGWIHVVNTVISALTVPFVVDLARRLGASTEGAVAAGVVLLIWPLCTTLAGMEDMLVLAGLLEVCALVGAARGDRVGDVLAVVAGGLAAHLRPDVAVVTAVPFALLALSRRWVPAAALAALVGVRAVEMVVSLPDDFVAHGAGILGWRSYTDGEFVASALRPGPDSPTVALNARWSPIAVAPLAVYGAVVGPARARWAAAAWVVSALVVVPKGFPIADPLRLQLPGLGFVAVLAGIGLAAAWERDRRLAVGAAVAVLFTAWVARAPLGGPWQWQEEYDFLRAHLDEVPPGTRVRYRDEGDPLHAFAYWASSGGAVWVGIDDADIAPGDVLWRGLQDRLAASWPPIRCDLTPIVEADVTPRTDGWVDLGESPVRIGFYTVGACH